jgi:chaperone LolA
MRTYIMLSGILLALACGGDPEPAPATEPSAGALPSLDVAVDSPLVVEPDRARADTADAPPQIPTMGPAPAPAGGAAAPASSDPADTPLDEAEATLRAAAEAYQNVRSMRADFVMRLNNRLLRTELTGRGTLYQQRPDRIALRFSDPAGEVILSDGEYFYVYQPGVNPGQAIRTRATTSSGGVDLQAQFVGDPTQRFQYTLEGTESVGGRPARVLTLVPRERTDYRSLKVWIDGRDALARRFEITEHNGSVRRFDLTGLQTNVPVPASVFRFVPPDGVRIIDP